VASLSQRCRYISQRDETVERETSTHSIISRKVRRRVNAPIVNSPAPRPAGHSGGSGTNTQSCGVWQGRRTSGRPPCQRFDLVLTNGEMCRCGWSAAESNPTLRLTESSIGFARPQANPLQLRREAYQLGTDGSLGRQV